MNLFKTSILNSFAVGSKVLAYFIINKVFAVLVGPVGYVALGQLQNAVQMITTFASGAINIGVTKYTAENVHDSDLLKKIWGTSVWMIIVGSLITCLLLFLFSDDLSLFFFSSIEFQYVFNWFSASLIFFNVNVLLLSVMIGKKEVKAYVLSNISGNVISLILVYLSVYYWGLKGGLIALVTFQSFSAIATLFFCSRLDWFRVENFFNGFSVQVMKNLGRFSAMALTSALCVPYSQILIRDFIKLSHSDLWAGYWEGVNKFSAAMLMIFTSTLSVYFLPRFSEIKLKNELKTEIERGVLFLAPLVLLIVLLSYFFRDFLVEILFSKDFYLVRDLFFWQMCGDFMRMMSWILAYVLLAKAYSRLFVFSEIIFSISLYSLTRFFFDVNNLSSLTLGYFVNYVLYYVFLFIVLKVKKDL